MADFSGIFNLIVQILPLIFLIAIINYIQKRFGTLEAEEIQRQPIRHKKLITVAVVFFVGSLLFAGMATTEVKGAMGSVTPASTTSIVGLMTEFSLTSLNASTSYTTYVNGVVYGTFTSSSTGTAICTVIVYAEGTYAITWKQLALGSVIATATVTSIDMVNLLVPLITLLISVTILIGIVEKLKLT